MYAVADLQIHSRFSRAVSKHMTFPHIALWAHRKGIGVVATGDWTHPVWFREIERDLTEEGNGLLRLNERAMQTMVSDTVARSEFGFVRPDPGRLPYFLLATEVSCIYSQNGKVRRVHTLIWVPTVESARKIGQEMTKRGCNLMSDGRPIVGLTSVQIAELVFAVEPKALVIPAHAWTPWFSVYGSLGGFDSISEAFGQYADRIYAIETGLSSSPDMNWRVPELNNRAILSFSDAHSGPKLGREATVFDMEEGGLSYDGIYQAIRNAAEHKTDVRPRIAYTIEFYPEEGKYHYTGHRACKSRQTPEETKTNGTTCPVCGKKLTVGVMHRVEELAGKTDAGVGRTLVASPDPSVQAKMYASSVFPYRPPFIMLVPLQEIIAEALGMGVTSGKVQSLYTRLTHEVGNEFDVLLRKNADEISRVAGARVSDGIIRVRRGQLHIDPGYDGVFGVVRIWNEGEAGIAESGKEQLSLLS